MQKATINFVMSVCPSVRMEERGSHWTDFHEILYLISFRKLSRKKITFRYIRTRIMITLHKDQYTFLIISRPVLLGMRNVPNKNCRGNKNTHFVFSNVLFFSIIVPVMR